MGNIMRQRGEEESSWDRIEDLRLENEILKKAAAYFAKESL